MKSISKIVCCVVALAWIHGANAEEDSAADTQVADATTTTVSGGGAPPSLAAPDDAVVPTPPAPRITVKPHHDKVSRTKVEKRIEDNATRTRKRSADAEKDVVERAKVQQGQVNPAQNAQ